MSDTADRDASGRRKTGPVLPALLFCSPLATSAAPRLTWLFLLLIAGAVIVNALLSGRGWRQLIDRNTAFIALLLVAFYALLSASWAADSGAAFGKAALLFGVVSMTFAASRALAGLDQPQLRRAVLAFAIGAFLGALFVLVELLTEGALTRMALNAGALLWGSEKNLASPHGDGEIKHEEFRRSVAVLVLHLWPALLVLSTIVSRRRVALVGLFVLAVAAPIIISERESSQVALAGSLLVFLLARFWRRGIARALAVFWCLAFVLVLPVTFAAYQSELHMAEGLPKSARHRIILWEYTAERVLESPWLGIGTDSTATLSKRMVAEQPKDFVAPRTTGPHAHNLFLQVWYELGLVGVVLAALAGAAIALRIPLLPPEAQPFAAATFAAFGATVAFAWGIWQTWLMCGVGLALLYLLMAVRAGPGDSANASGVVTNGKKPSG